MNKQSATFHFAAKDLDKKDLFGKSDPFMVISRMSSEIDGERASTQVYSSEVVKKTLNPSWDTFTIPLKDLCNGDLERPILFEIFDYDLTTKISGDKVDIVDAIGSFTATFAQLKTAFIEQSEFKCINAKKAAKKKKSYSDSGKVILKFM